ncbi:MAG: hypothetical protein J6B06_07795 [Lachnospiraceae bacterium]|nr:hypothetical protein [Lachnospiraceae bacterium]
MKKLFTLLSLVITLSCINFIPAFASNVDDAELIRINPNTSITSSPTKENHFEFTQGKSRISSDGSFTFSFNRGVLHSSTFQPRNSTLQVNICASCSVHDSCYYYVFLMKEDSDTLVKKVKFYADSNEWGYTFSGLTPGADYYLDFSKNATCTGCIDGEGQVSPIQ